MSTFTFNNCVVLLDFSAVSSGKCLFTLNCSSNYLVSGEGDLLQGLLWTIRLFSPFRSLTFRSVLQIRTAAAFSCVFNFISLSLSHPSLVLSDWSFVPSHFLAERDESCGLICGSAAKYRIHLVLYEICTIKSEILLEK